MYSCMLLISVVAELYALPMCKYMHVKASASASLFDSPLHLLHLFCCERYAAANGYQWLFSKLFSSVRVVQTLNHPGYPITRRVVLGSLVMYRAAHGPFSPTLNEVSVTCLAK